VARTRLIVGLITPHHIYLTIMKPIREAKARFRAVVPLKKKKKNTKFNRNLLSSFGDGMGGRIGRHDISIMRSFDLLRVKNA
jgi:hypothetical protein